MSTLKIQTPRWAKPLLDHKRYKGASGGRASGKSHFFAEAVVEHLIYNPDDAIVCIREVQKSLKHSAKRLIENKIQSLGVGHLFEAQAAEIKRIGHDGLIIFQGMQDHTAESIKSLEGFKVAWIEEAQSLSKRSLELLIPTIRSDESELWFSWNPDKETDAVEQINWNAPNAVRAHVNYIDNPWCPKAMRKEAESMRSHDIELYNHIWLGGHRKVSDAVIFKGKYVVRSFTPDETWDGPYFGLDFGFSNDPTAGCKLWIHDNKLYVEYDASKVGLELDDTSDYLMKRLPGIEKHVCRADNARPESISYLKRHGMPRVEPCEKGKGSIEDGIAFIKTFDQIVIHPRCEGTKYECDNYSYKVDKRSGDVMPVIVDDNNHIIDSIRYALEPIMKRSSTYTLSNL